MLEPKNTDVLGGVDDENALAMKYGVMSIPTLIILKDGKEKSRIVGARPKADILSKLLL